MKTKFVSIERATRIIQKELYQPKKDRVLHNKAETLTEKMKLELTRDERVKLQQLKASLEQIKIDSKKVLVLDPAIEINQTTIDKTQIERLISAFTLTRNELTRIIKALEEQINEPQKYSPQYIQCLTKVKENLNKLLSLIKEYQDENKTAEYYRNFYKKNLRGDDIHSLCRLLGVVYFPINQGLDPFFGGTEENGRVLQSDGECAGKVVSWIYACSKDEPIKYPFYVGEYDKQYQMTQADIRSKFTLKNSDNAHQFTAKLFDRIEDQKIYYISLNSSSNGGHAIGLRKRKDGVYELFDSNYVHAFITTKEMFNTLLTNLVTRYACDFGLDTGYIYEAEVSQSIELKTHFPNKMSLIPASFAQYKSNNEPRYVELLKSLILNALTALHKEPQHKELLRNLLLSNLENMLVMINELETLDQIDALFRERCVKGNLLDSNVYKDAVSRRRALISDKGFREEVIERRREATDYIAAEQTIIAELNTVKEQLVKASADADSVQRHHDEEGLAVKAMKLHQYITRLRQSEAPVKLFLQPLVNLGKKIVNSVRNAVTSIFRKINSAAATEMVSIASEVKTTIAEANREYEQHKTTTDKPVLQKRSQLNRLINGLLLNLLLVKKQTEEKRQSNLNFQDDSMDSVARERTRLHLERVHQNCLERTEVLIASLKAIQKETIEQYKGEEEVDKQAQQEVVKLESRVHQLVKIDATTRAHLLSETPRDDEFVEQMFNTLYESAFAHCPDIEYTDAEAPAHQSTADRVELLKSLQRIIDHLSELREAYVEKIRSKYLTHLQGNFELQFLRQKLLSEIDKISAQIRVLIALKNPILKSNDPDLFDQTAIKVRALYPAFFANNFKLPDNFVHGVATQFQVNLNPTLSDAEKKVIERFNDKDRDFQKAIDKYSQTIQACFMEKEKMHQKAATTKDHKEKFLSAYQAQHLDTLCALLGQLKMQVGAQQESLKSMTIKNLKALDEMQVEFPDTSRLLRDNCLAYWSMVTAGELYKVQRLDIYLRDDPNVYSDLNLPASTNQSLIPAEVTTRYNQYADSQILLCQKKIKETEGITVDLVNDFLTLFPSLYHSNPEVLFLKNDLLSVFLRIFQNQKQELSTHIYTVLGGIKTELEDSLSPVDSLNLRNAIEEKIDQVNVLMDSYSKDQPLSLDSLNALMEKLNTIVPSLVDSNYQLAPLRQSVLAMKRNLAQAQQALPDPAPLNYVM